MNKLSTDNPSRRFSLKSKIFCILFGVFMALVALELFLRLLGFGYNLMHKAPVDTGADYKIYCVGESTTWGIGASDPLSKGYPHQLEEMLNEKYRGRKIQCFFDQTIGQNTSEILVKLSRHIEKYKPQLVILMVGANNWWNMDRSNILLFNKYSSVSEMTLTTMIYLDQFRVWKLFKNVAFSSGFLRERWNYWFPKGMPREELEEEIGGEADLDIFDRLAEHDTEEMVRLVRARGIRMVLCTYPVDSKEMVDFRRDLARKYQTAFVDLCDDFQKLKDPQAYLWSEDHWHPNDAGYGVVARNIYDCIVKSGFIRERRSHSQ